jgi:integrase/recombinase XerD
MSVYVREVLTVKEIALIMGSFPDTFAGRRNRAMTLVQFRCMLRVSELLSLIPSDYNVNAHTIRVRRGKGNKSRIVHVPADAREALDAWMAERGSIGGKKPIFCTENGDGLHRCNVNKVLKHTAELAGIDKRVHTHQMRYSGASMLFRAGANLSLVQGQLGHSKVSTTSQYLLDVDPSERVDALEKIKW